MREGRREPHPSPRGERRLRVSGASSAALNRENTKPPASPLRRLGQASPGWSPRAPTGTVAGPPPPPTRRAPHSPRTPAVRVFRLHLELESMFYFIYYYFNIFY